MKRALIVFLLLAMVAGGLFAEVTFGGGVASGLLIGFDEDGYGFYTSKSDGGNAYDYSFNFSYTGESGRVGGRIAANGAAGSGWNFDGSKIWFKPLDILEIAGGGGDIGGFGTPGPVGAGNGAAARGGGGVNAVLKPIPGLALGLGVSPRGLEFTDAFYGLGASYDLTGIAKIVANLGLDLKGKDEDGKDQDPGVNAAAGVSISALSNIAGLNIGLDVAADNVNKLSETGKVTAGLSVGFKVGDLSATVKGKALIPVTDAQSDLGLNAILGAEFGYPVTPAISANLGIGYTLKGASTVGQKFNPGYWDAMPFDFTNVDSSVLAVHPSISFKVAEASFKTGYGLKTNIGGEAKLNHEVYTGVSIGF